MYELLESELIVPDIYQHMPNGVPVLRQPEKVIFSCINLDDIHTISNNTGTIDRRYRGEMVAIIYKSIQGTFVFADNYKRVLNAHREWKEKQKLFKTFN